jgi:hypothetical protein
MFWLVVAWIAVTVISYLLQKDLAPRVAKRGPGELQAPIAEQGYPIPVIFGTVKLKGPNVVWYQNKTKNSTNSAGQYDYYVLMQLALCHGPVDRLRQVWFSDKIPKTVQLVKQDGAPFVNNAAGIMTSISKTNAIPNYLATPAFTKWLCGDNPDTDTPLPGHAGYNLWGLPIDEETGKGEAPNKGWFYMHEGYHDYPRMDYLIPIEPASGDTLLIDNVLHEWKGNAQGWVVYAAPIVGGPTELKIDGGTSGRLQFWAGKPLQATNTDLQAAQRGTDPMPTYGGLCYVYLDGKYCFNPKDGYSWGNSESLPNVAFELERCPDPLGMGDSIAAILSDRSPSGRIATTYLSRGTGTYMANPAEVLYEILTNPDWGIGIPPVNINVASFRDSARILAYEKLGMNMILDTQSPLDDVSGDVCKTIDGALFTDPSTGQWTLRLVRDEVKLLAVSGLEDTEYFFGTPISFTEDDMIGAPTYTRGSWGDVANEVKIQYIDQMEGYAQRIVQVQDIANYQTQGEVVSVQNVYNGIIDSSVAIQLAYRDLRTVGFPRSRVTFTVNRRAYKLNPCDRFIFNYPSIGVLNMVMRVGDVRYGTLDNGQIQIDAIEDVFSLPETVYQEPDSGWIDVSQIDPVAPVAVRGWELPYDVTRDGPRVTLGVLAARGDEYTTGARLFGAIDNDPFKEIKDIAYTPTGFVSGFLAERESGSDWGNDSAVIQGTVDFDAFAATASNTDGENLMLVNDEVISFRFLSENADGTWTISGLLRGVLDTIPAYHNTGDRVWLIRRPDYVQQLKGQSYHDEKFSVVAYNSKKSLDQFTQQIYNGSTYRRSMLPFPPGRFRFGDRVDWADYMEPLIYSTGYAQAIRNGNFKVSWRWRNRLTQAPSVTAQNAPSVFPEAGQATRIRLRTDSSNSEFFKLIEHPDFPTIDGTVIPFGVPFNCDAIDWGGSWGQLYYPQDYYGRETGPMNYVGYWMNVDTLPTGTTTPARILAVMYDSTQDPCLYLSYYEEFIESQVKDAIYLKLYRLTYSIVGGKTHVTVTDLRPANADCFNVTRSYPQESDEFTVSQVLDPVGQCGPVPFICILDSSAPEGVSKEVRQSAPFYPCGWGVEWGTLWGGWQ